ncbi:RNaseH domain-containing protein [Streptomyces sp. NPDC001220]
MPGPWAAITHQLRRAPDYNVTPGLPLPLHMAAKTAQYVLPHDGDSDESSGEEGSPPSQ